MMSDTCGVSMAAWAVLVGLVASGAAAAAPEDWPQFRGPTGDGIAVAKDPPLAWSESENVLWKLSIPGRAGSSPVVLGNRIWLTTAVVQGPRKVKIGPDDAEAADHVALGAACLDRAEGKILWQAPIFEVDKPAPVHYLNTFATPTPVVEPGRLYCDFGAMGTACLDAENGKTFWTERLAVDHMVGPGSSPILCKDLLVLVRDGCDAQFVAALDKKTGKAAWKTPRPPLEARYDMKKAYSTPLVIEAAGRDQMIAVGAQWAVSYDPATGKELWRVKHGTGFSLAPRPVYGNGMVYVATGCLVPQLWAIRVDGQGDATGTHVAWKATEQIPVMSSPILVGKELYCVSDQGRITCFDALTGQALWKHFASGTYLASPVFADGRLYFFSREGKTTVLAAGRQLEKLAENKLDGPMSATPALVGGTILFRTDTHLYCIGHKPGPTP